MIGSNFGSFGYHSAVYSTLSDPYDDVVVVILKHFTMHVNPKNYLEANGIGSILMTAQNQEKNILRVAQIFIS